MPDDQARRLARPERHTKIRSAKRKMAGDQLFSFLMLHFSLKW
jgi:hypothetical protein